MKILIYLMILAITFGCLATGSVAEEGGGGGSGDDLPPAPPPVPPGPPPVGWGPIPGPMSPFPSPWLESGPVVFAFPEGFVPYLPQDVLDRGFPAVAAWSNTTQILRVKDYYTDLVNVCFRLHGFEVEPVVVDGYLIARLWNNTTTYYGIAIYTDDNASYNVWNPEFLHYTGKITTTSIFSQNLQEALAAAKFYGPVTRLETPSQWIRKVWRKGDTVYYEATNASGNVAISYGDHIDRPLPNTKNGSITCEYPMLLRSGSGISADKAYINESTKKAW